MLVQDLGEFELIDTLARSISDENDKRIQRLGKLGFHTLRSIGDDAAAWRSPQGARVFTADAMVEGVHFDLRYTNWRDLGWKSLATNISDIAAMGCVPSYATVTLGLRGDLPVDGLIEMYKGMTQLTNITGGAVIGGDVVKSPAFFISIALEGMYEADEAEIHKEGCEPRSNLMFRDAASPGDEIAVTGNLGSSAGGLKLLMEGAQNAAADYDLLQAHNRPMPRVAEGAALARLGVRCAMDISDGLVDDIAKLCAASKVGAEIHAPRIPVVSRLKAVSPENWLELALGGGEDYELLFTAPSHVMRAATQALATPITVIGKIVPAGQGVTILDADGSELTIGSGGWDHFRAV